MTLRNSKDLSVGTVAYILGVDPKTVTRWCNEGKLAHYRTIGGHRRIRAEEIDRIREANDG